MVKRSREGFKMVADFIKWLASVTTLLMGGGGLVLFDKIKGTGTWIFAGALLLFAASLICGGISFLAIAAGMDLEEQGNFEDAEENFQTSKQFLMNQWILFFVGFIAFLLAAAWVLGWNSSATQGIVK